MAGAGDVLCLADELQGQALRLEATTCDFDDIYNGLDYNLPIHSRSSLSLFEPDCFLGSELDNIEPCDFTSLDGPCKGPASCSQGPSSAGSCEQSNEVEGAGAGLEWTSIAYCQISGTRTVMRAASGAGGLFSEQHVAAPGLDQADGFGPLASDYAGPSSRTTMAWRGEAQYCSGPEMLSNATANRQLIGRYSQLPASGTPQPLLEALHQPEYYAADAGTALCNIMPSQLAGPVYKSSFVPAPRVAVAGYSYKPSWACTPFGAEMDAPQGMAMGAARGLRKHFNSDSLTVVSGGQMSGDASAMFGHPQCHSPLSGDSTPGPHMDLGGPGDGLLLGRSSGLGEGEALLHVSRRRQPTLEVGRTSQDATALESFGCGSPRATGHKRALAGSGPVARKLMTHPEGRSCTQCNVKTTPVWRAGPLGPKTLCNACGVRYSKIARKK